MAYKLHSHLQPSENSEGGWGVYLVMLLLLLLLLLLFFVCFVVDQEDGISQNSDHTALPRIQPHATTNNFCHCSFICLRKLERREEHEFILKAAFKVRFYVQMEFHILKYSLKENLSGVLRKNLRCKEDHQVLK